MNYDDTATERHLRIFISSTFRDMQQEREELIKHVFPQVKKIAKERFVDITEVDLRWGVTEEQAENGEALKICLDEINKCKSSPVFFIGILGERYGWIPNQTDPKLLNDEKYTWIVDYQERSVTELEILHGVLNDKYLSKRSFFYFRDQALSEEISKELTPPLEPEMSLAKDRLHSLKKTIRTTQTLSLDGYASIKAFGEQVKEDLIKELERLFPADQVPSEKDKVRLRHAQFAQSRKFYIPDPQADDELDTFFTSSQSYCLIEAESGMGKSSFIVHSVNRYRKLRKDALIIEHYIGGGDSSSELYSLLNRILNEIKETYNIEEELPIFDKLEEEFSLWLHKIPNNQECIIFIDALNQLDDTKAQKLFWLPVELPKQVQIIISSINSLEKEHAQRIKLSHLNQERQETFIHEYLAKSGKSLDTMQRSVLLESPNTQNPLFLKVLLDELKLFGVYEEVNAKIETLLSHSSIDDLLETVLERIEHDYDKHGTLKEILSLIYVSRDGMSEEELLEIINSTTIGRLQEEAECLRLTRADLSAILLALDEHIIEKEGLLNFFHAFMEKAVVDRYALDDTLTINSYRSRIAEYLETDIGNKEIRRVARELPYQLHLLKEEVRLLNAIMDYRIFSFETHDTWCIEIHSYYLSIQSITDKEDRLFGGLTDSISLIKDDMKKAHLINAIALYFEHYIGAYEKSLSLFEKVLESSKWALGEAHPETLGYMNNLGELLKSMGSYEKALPLYEKTLKFRKQVLGEVHPDTIGSMNNLGGLYKSMGSYDKALPLYKKTLELSKQVFGETHPDTLGYMNNLGGLYMSMGMYEQALPLLDQALELRKQVLGERHPDILRSMNNLGLLHKSMGSYEKALPLYKKTLELTKQVLGERHPDTIRSMNNLGGFYTSMGMYEQALSLLDQALELSKQVFGEAHPDTLDAMHNLGLLHESMGSYEKALPLYKKTLELRKQVLGERHPATLSSMNNLGVCYYSIGTYEEAQPLYEMTLELRKQVLGERHPDTLDAMYNLGLFHESMKEYKQALPLYKKTLELRKQVLGDRHPDTLGSMRGLMIFYFRQKYYHEALHYTEELYPLLVQYHGNESDEVQKIASFLMMLRQKTDCDTNDQTVKTLLYISKGIAINKCNNAIEPLHFYNSLYFVALSEKAYDVFSHIFGKENMKMLEKFHGGNELVELAKSHPKIQYSDELKPLIKQLQEYFGDEAICRMH